MGGVRPGGGRIINERKIMNAIVLLSVVMAGQVKGAPPTDAVALSRTVSGQPIIAPRYVIHTYKVRHEELTFNVRGYYRPDLKRIVWNEADEFNQRSYSMALITQPTFGFEQEETSPAVARPLIASRPASRGGANGPASVIGMPVIQSRAPNSLRNSRN
jgi:hypothetical protein